MSKVRKFLFFSIGLLLVTLSLVGCGGGSDSSSTGNTQEPIKLGFFSSFTGTYRQNGYNGLAGVKLAVAEINASGGILGRQVIVVEGDDQSSPTAAIDEIRRLVQTEKIDALIGPISSQITLATIPFLNEAKIPSISVTGSSAMTPTVGPYHFSMLPSADSQAEAIVNYIATTLQVSSAAIIHDDGAQAASTVIALKKELTKRNIRFTGSQQYAISSTDMTDKLKALNDPNDPPGTLIALTGTSFDTAYILKNRQEMGWNIPVVGNITVAAAAENAVKIAGPAAYEGVAGVKMTHVPYKGSGPAMTDMLAGQTQVWIANAPVVLPHIQSGKLRALATTSASRPVIMTNIPTLNEAGLKGYEADTWYGIFAPAKTPQPILDKLNADIVSVLKSKDITDRFAAEGAFVVANSSADFTKKVSDDVAKWKKVITELNLQIN